MMMNVSQPHPHHNNNNHNILAAAATMSERQQQYHRFHPAADATGIADMAGQQQQQQQQHRRHPTWSNNHRSSSHDDITSLLLQQQQRLPESKAQQQRHVIGYAEQHRSKSFDDIGTIDDDDDGSSTNSPDRLSKQMLHRRSRSTATPGYNSHKNSSSNAPALAVPQFHPPTDCSVPHFCAATDRFLREHQNHANVCIQIGNSYHASYHHHGLPHLAAVLSEQLERRQPQLTFNVEERPDRIVFYIQNNNDTNNDNEDWRPDAKPAAITTTTWTMTNHNNNDHLLDDTADPALQVAMRLSVRDYHEKSIQQQKQRAVDGALEMALRLSVQQQGQEPVVGSVMSDHDDETDHHHKSDSLATTTATSQNSISLSQEEQRRWLSTSTLSSSNHQPQPDNNDNQETTILRHHHHEEDPSEHSLDLIHEQQQDDSQRARQIQTDEDIALRVAQYGSAVFENEDDLLVEIHSDNNDQEKMVDSNNDSNHASFKARDFETDSAFAFRLARDGSGRGLESKSKPTTSPYVETATATTTTTSTDSAANSAMDSQQHLEETQRQQQQQEDDAALVLAELLARKKELLKQIQEQEDEQLALRLARQGSEVLGGGPSQPQEAEAPAPTPAPPRPAVTTATTTKAPPVSESLNHSGVRGIPNTTGTACHILSPLALLFYSIPPIREILLELAIEHRAQGAHPLLRELSLLFRQMDQQIRGVDTTTMTNNVVDPRPVYQAFLDHLGVEARSLGDATTALSKLIFALRQSTSSSEEHVVAKVVEAAIGTGRMQSRMEGGQGRTKDGRTRSLAVPFSLSVADDTARTSLDECLRRYSEPMEIENYTWSTGSYDNLDLEHIPDEACLELDDCITTKTNTLLELPGWWIIHLDRFRYDKGRVLPKSTKVEIPFQLDCNQLFPSLSHSANYHLKGAILHVNTVATDGELEEDGHYVTLIPSPKTANQPGPRQQRPKLWYLLDDDDVTPLTADEAQELMAGGENTEHGETREMRAVVLVYECNDIDVPQGALQQAKAELAEYPTQQQQEGEGSGQDLVGKRLRIQWSKGRQYSGVITHYDESNGKHTVLYDDGDVRTYTLSKKSIEWE